ncbi:MAG: hypothetical protein ACRD10_14280, partial [Terriglobia bacterium]
SVAHAAISGPNGMAPRGKPSAPRLMARASTARRVYHPSGAMPAAHAMSAGLMERLPGGDGRMYGGSPAD